MNTADRRASDSPADASERCWIPHTGPALWNDVAMTTDPEFLSNLASSPHAVFAIHPEFTVERDWLIDEDTLDRGATEHHAS